MTCIVQSLESKLLKSKMDLIDNIRFWWRQGSRADDICGTHFKRNK